MFRSVMVPADQSEDFRLVMKFVEGLTAIGVRRVVLARVIDASGMEGPVIAAQVDRGRDQLRELAAEIMDPRLEVEIRVGTGDPSQGLLSIASETHVDGVVLGTHGKGLLDTLIAGSLSEEMAAHAEVPTILVRYDLLRTKEDPAELARSFGKTVIVPTDFSGSSMRALMSVLELPHDALGLVYFVHALDKGLTTEKLVKAEEGAEFQLKNNVRVAEQAGLTARCLIMAEDPVRAVLSEANERRATGIVVGSRGQNALQEALLGSTSMTLVRQASCPVMIVP